MKTIATQILCGVIVMAAAGFASAALVDDFENGEIGNIGGQTAANGETWLETNKTNSTIEVDPLDDTNKVLLMRKARVQAGVNTGMEIAPGQVGTLSFRAMLGRSADPSDAVDQVWEIGLSSWETIENSSGDRHAVGFVGCVSGDFVIGTKVVDPFVWHDVEMVFDLTGATLDDYTVSMFVDGEAAGEGMINPSQWSNWDGTTSLKSVQIEHFNDSWRAELRIDDVAMVPEPMSLSLLGLGGLALLRRRRA